MIVKILSASKSFSGVEYNDKKIEKGKGELMAMKNFPSFINEESSPRTVKDYLKTISKSNKVKKPQFHAVISTKFQEHSKEELTIIAEEFMQEMKYGQQPYILIFHNDTENNHIHIVSTRVDKKNGKKIDDSFERLKSQKALQKVMDKLYPEQKLNETLEKLLNYKYSSLNQLKELLERNGFKLSKNSEDVNQLDILKNGVLQKKLIGNQLSFNANEDKDRKRQIRGIIKKYSEIYSNTTFKVVDDRKQKGLKEEVNSQSNTTIEWESELQKKLRDMFGIDIIFHHKGELTPFGYTVIDNKSKSIFKGSEILKINQFVEFTNEQIDKKNFESLKDFNIHNETQKKVLQEWFNSRTSNPIQEYMLFYNKKSKKDDTVQQVKGDVLDLIKSGKELSDKVEMVSVNEKKYAIHTQLHQVWDINGLLNVSEKYFKGERDSDDMIEIGIEVAEGITESIEDIIRPNYGAEIEDEFDLRKRKRKKR